MTYAPEWHSPLDYARGLAEQESFALLHSGMAPGRYSILAWELSDKTTSLPEFEKLLSSNKNKYENNWFGYFGYGLRHEFENLPKQKPSYVSLPDLLMMQFKNIAVFDNQLQKIALSNSALPKPMQSKHLAHSLTQLTSNMTDGEYMVKVAKIIEKIKEGELYQANLTRKFFGEFQTTQNAFDIFSSLSQASPAPYSAYIKFGDTHIISASPEKFLTVENGIATTTPIKGTLSSASPAALLAMSQKDRAENLMIVDLMRNDLSRSCKNVKVEKLFEVTSYAKYHHMSSTITGELETNALDAVKHCFPPGSMTGAPKIQAMKLCGEMENIERGVYSGALGWFGGDGSCDLSVVIRTLIIQGKKFEFQVGGGIVADSTPQKELEEIYVKAHPILEVLNANYTATTSLTSGT